MKPVASRSDYSAIEGFLTRLSSSNMSKLVEENPKDLAKYGLDKPVMTVTIGAGSAKTVLEVGKTEERRDLRAATRRGRWCSRSTRTLQGDLNKSFDDYRKKELFEFRPFYAREAARGARCAGRPEDLRVREGQSRAKPADPETWKVTRVGGASHTADQAAMDDLLNKLIAIKAESFVDAKTKTGLDKPALVVSASFDEGKFERVRFGQVGENAYGARDGEAGIAKIEHSSMRAALQAFDAVVMPPEPRTAAPKGGREEVSDRARVRSLLTTIALARFAQPAARRRRRQRRRRVRGASRSRPSPKNNCAAICSAIFADSRRRSRASGRCRCSSLKHGDTLYSLNPIAHADAGVEPEADHQRRRGRAARLGLSLHHADLRDRADRRRRRSRRRPGDRRRTAIRRSTRGIPSAGARSTSGRSSSTRRASAESAVS